METTITINWVVDLTHSELALKAKLFIPANVTGEINGYVNRQTIAINGCISKQ